LHNSINILKFGGTSVATTEKMSAIASKIKSRYDQGEKLVIVVSAMGKSTDLLINLAQEINRKPNKRELDMLLSTGEQVSIALMAMALEDAGMPSIALTGAQAGIYTDAHHSKARIKDIKTDKILSLLNDNQVVVVAGFQGVTHDGSITTLGRGGSDTTAVSLAAALKGNCEIYTDVDGVYSIDPRIYACAKKRECIAYDEMLELASTGATIMDTRAIEIGHHYNVPLYIALNDMITLGTYIKELDPTMEKNAVTGMSISKNCLMVTLSRIPADYKLISAIFADLARAQVIVDMISQTAPQDGRVTLSFTTTREDRETVESVIAHLVDKEPHIHYTFESQVVKLSVVGVGMVSQSGVAASIFQVFSENDIPYYQVTTSEISISYTIPIIMLDIAVEKIAKLFDL
jgi:aspartate kinase